MAKKSKKSLSELSDGDRLIQDLRALESVLQSQSPKPRIQMMLILIDKVLKQKYLDQLHGPKDSLIMKQLQRAIQSNAMTLMNIQGVVP